MKRYISIVMVTQLFCFISFASDLKVCEPASGIYLEYPHSRVLYDMATPSVYSSYLGYNNDGSIYLMRYTHLHPQKVNRIDGLGLDQCSVVTSSPSANSSKIEWVCDNLEGLGWKRAEGFFYVNLESKSGELFYWNTAIDGEPDAPRGFAFKNCGDIIEQ